MKNNLKIEYLFIVFLVCISINIKSYAQVLDTKISDYADYVVLGKSINHRQSTSNELTLLNTVFFAEIFPVNLNSNIPTITDAYLEGPGDAKVGMKFSNEKIPFLAGTRGWSISELTERYPDETYYFNFKTPVGIIKDLPATFVQQEDIDNNPGPIEITLYQNNMIAQPDFINPNYDIKVTWSPFEKGERDSNSIIDDMIYVILGDCLGQEIDHSGHAISDIDALTYDQHQYIIPHQKLAPGQPYQLEVEHSNMETDIKRNIEIIVTYAATTFLDFRTTGENVSDLDCPRLPYSMDGGQTDRPKKKF